MSEELTRTWRGRTLFGPFRAVGPEQIDQLEADLGTRLPAGYRDFIQIANGGVLPYAATVSPDGETVLFDNLYRVDQLLRARKALAGTVPLDAFAAARIDIESLLPVGFDEADSMLLLDLSTVDGRVVAFALGAVLELADSFDGYLDGLHVDDDCARWVWEEFGDSPEPVEQWLDAELPGWREKTWAV